MLFINHLNKNIWWELDKEKMMVFNYSGGYHYIDKESLANAESCECENWHELYLKKSYCPLECDKRGRDIWISPDGKFYEVSSHEVGAECLCEIIYGLEEVDWAGDELESRGWLRATTSLMWEVRFDEWKEKNITQKQYDALWDWCKYHKKSFPQKVNVR